MRGSNNVSTGAAILVAYLTPSKVSLFKVAWEQTCNLMQNLLFQGLSCRSGSYIIYGALSTIAWNLLVVSMLFSHSSMLRYQHTYYSLYQNWDNHTSIDGKTRTRDPSLSHTLCNVAAVTTRILGKIIATVNAIWIVSFSTFEFVGLYENCWCSADTISAHDKGWVMIFKKGPDLAPYVSASWYGSVVSSFAIIPRAYMMRFVAG